MLVANSYDRQIGDAARILSSGGVVAFPTDTVYGLGADIRNAAAVDRIYTIKGRPKGSPLPVLISDISRITDVVDDPAPLALHLASLSWPGGLTLVVPTGLPLPEALLQDGCVGVRVPDDPICIRLIERLGSPITGTSANRSGQPAAINARQVREQLGTSVDYILDAGQAQQAKPSTVVRVAEGKVTVLREGVIPSQAIMKAWQDYETSVASA
ncbi:MAG: threonylcarbamoyl-AMP synthase [Dehalococcoidia bacterium]|nr:threonylcarbamoyl-AMP synthase [Dehalococcoidia bacterium]